MKRRDIIKSFSLLPFAGGVLGGVLSPQSALASPYEKKEIYLKNLAFALLLMLRVH